MAKAFNQEAAEREANEIAFQFQNSTDVIGDMSRAYHTDFSRIRIHTDEAADRRVQEIFDEKRASALEGVTINANEQALGHRVSSNDSGRTDKQLTEALEARRANR